jgi:hypothetical protein
MAFRWCVKVASVTPTASASSRWFASFRVFRFSSTSHTGSEPPASASAASNARLTIRAARASRRPIGGTSGGFTAAMVPSTVDI